MKRLRMAAPLVCAAGLALLVGGGPAAAQTEVIVLRSGNGVVGGTDSQIHYTRRDNSQFTTIGNAEFSAARAGAAASIVTPFFGSSSNFWVPTLPGDPQARWISGRSDIGAHSALYAYSFNVTTADIASAFLDLRYAVDNTLGNATSAGLYLNEQAVPSSFQPTGYGQEYSFSADITSLLRPGTNTFYFHQHDFGGVAGSIFSARLTVNGPAAAVPEPTGALLFLPGLAAFGLLKIRRNGRGPAC